MRKERLELSRVSPLDPKSSASASSATFACRARTGSCGRPFRPRVRVQYYNRCLRALPARCPYRAPAHDRADARGELRENSGG